ncbi:ScyD/ScyE family protein [Amnibacterium sp. CER49]|uniref:ScyD/ScyE family protein n=1 Tax=Amnibacterium sp. CER49 TaxID=3039161 RepID=UPI0024479C75|nr:ScyD/ScyE family protein [Amnibacterium sp. CER49]MDH2444177.1 ScyD/ScyE family protein [Amnibacterium sp. CER49]
MSVRKALAVAAAAGLGIAVATGAGGASAATPQLKVTKVLSSAYVAPLQFAVRGSQVYVADSAMSTLTEIHNPKHVIARGGTPTSNPEASGDLAGVAASDEAVAYTQSTGDHKDTRLTVLQDGHVKLRVSLSTFEAQHNPDHRNTYGAVGSVNAKCSAELTKGTGSVRYRGKVDSHPYAVAALDHDAWLVADAGGNDILKVDRHGAISVVAVLPPQTLHVTADLAKALGAPDCAGIDYRTEPVPTDVETGPGGIYVSTLPGGPEAPGVPARGSVWRIHDCHLTRLATGFALATNIAVAGNGDVYVAQLGAGAIAKVHEGRVSTAAMIPGVVGVEWANNHLYASTAPAVTGGKAPGQILLLG